MPEGHTKALFQSLDITVAALRLQQFLIGASSFQRCGDLMAGDPRAEVSVAAYCLYISCAIPHCYLALSPGYYMADTPNPQAQAQMKLSLTYAANGDNYEAIERCLR